MEASQGRSPVHRAVCPWIGCVDKFYPPAPVEVADKRNFAAAERAAAIEPHNHDALGFHLPFYGARDRVKYLVRRRVAGGGGPLIKALAKCSGGEPMSVVRGLSPIACWIHEQPALRSMSSGCSWHQPWQNEVPGARRV